MSYNAHAVSTVVIINGRVDQHGRNLIKQMRPEEELKRAHRIRHDGIALEERGLLVEAEARYDEALQLYRQYSSVNDLDYANAVRYAAVIKERLRKFDEAALLWSEALERYTVVGVQDGIVEAQLHIKGTET